MKKALISTLIALTTLAAAGCEWDSSKYDATVTKDDNGNPRITICPGQEIVNINNIDVTGGSGEDISGEMFVKIGDVYCGDSIKDKVQMVVMTDENSDYKIGNKGFCIIKGNEYNNGPGYNECREEVRNKYKIEINTCENFRNEGFFDLSMESELIKRINNTKGSSEKLEGKNKLIQYLGSSEFRVQELYEYRYEDINYKITEEQYNNYKMAIDSGLCPSDYPRCHFMHEEKDFFMCTSIEDKCDGKCVGDEQCVKKSGSKDEYECKIIGDDRCGGKCKTGEYCVDPELTGKYMCSKCQSCAESYKCNEGTGKCVSRCDEVCDENSQECKKDDNNNWTCVEICKPSCKDGQMCDKIKKTCVAIDKCDGECTNSQLCDGETKKCVNKSLICEGAKNTSCASGCYSAEDLKNNHDNCGGCGNVCGETQYCDDGTCKDNACSGNVCTKAGCANTDTQCGTQCVDCTANATGHCDDGKCVIERCDENYHLSESGRCEMNSAIACAAQNVSASDVKNCYNEIGNENNKVLEDNIYCNNNGNCDFSCDNIDESGQYIKIGDACVSRSVSDCNGVDCNSDVVDDENLRLDETACVVSSGNDLTCQYYCNDGWMFNTETKKCEKVECSVCFCEKQPMICSGLNANEIACNSLDICSPISCLDEYHLYDNTCELDNEINCGTHGNSCMKEHVKEAECNRGSGSPTCKTKSCETGYYQDGNECKEYDVDNCGSKGTKCSSIVPNATGVSCTVNGNCIATGCNDGYDLQAGSCVKHICNENETKCDSDGKFYTCHENSWGAGETCKNGCNDSGCLTDGCTDGEIKCEGAKISTCTGGAWGAETNCLAPANATAICNETSGCGYECNDGYCGKDGGCVNKNTDMSNCGECGKSCDTLSVQHSTAVTCAEGKCKATACKSGFVTDTDGSCKPDKVKLCVKGTTKCEDNKYYECGSDAQWGAGVPCTNLIPFSSAVSCNTDGSACSVTACNTGFIIQNDECVPAEHKTRCYNNSTEGVLFIWIESENKWEIKRCGEGKMCRWSDGTSSTEASWDGNACQE